MAVDSGSSLMAGLRGSMALLLGMAEAGPIITSPSG